MLLLLLTSVVVIFVLHSWIQLLRTCGKFKISGPTPLPFIGNAHLFIVASTEFLNVLFKISQKYGDIFLVHLFSTPYAILSHPKYIEPIISSSELITKGKDYDFLKVWLGQGLLTATGQRWRFHRKFLTPAFHFNVLQNFFPIFCKNGKILSKKLERLADGKTVDLFPLIALAALDNVTEAVMGVSVDSQQNSESEYVKSIEVLTRIMAFKMQVPLIGDGVIFNMLPYKREQDKALRYLRSYTINVIEARRQDLKKININSIAENSSSGETDDFGIKNKHAFLDLLLLTKMEGKNIDEESVREEVDTFMFEGHDTTSSGIVYSLFCISKYPEIQHKLYEEQRNIFLDDIERDPTFAEINQMKYMELVIKEALRLYPSVPFISRKTTKDTQLFDMNILQGTNVILNIFQMHRNPAVFEDPLAFKPERFESMDMKNPFSYLAFSAGPRNCIGQKFAWMELKVTISEVIRRFKLLPAGIEPQLCADLVLRAKDGVHVKLIPRNSI